jgi:flagellar protein FliO/FliZ
MMFFTWFQWMGETATSASLPTKTPLNEAETLPASATSMPLLLLQTVFALGIIIALIYVLFRFIGKRSNAFFGRAGIRTLGGCSLGPQKSLQVVQVGSSLYIIGVGENVTLLRCIDNPAEVEALMETLESTSLPSSAASLSLKEWTQSFFNKRGRKEGTEDFAMNLQLKVEEARQRREEMEKEWFHGEKDKER